MEKNRTVLIGNLPIDHMVKNGNTIQYSPGGIANLCRYLTELVEPNTITPVSKIGNDKYANHVKGPLSEMCVNTNYILEVEDESRLYEMDVTEPQIPKINRKQDAKKLMATPLEDISQILDETAVIFYHSFATVFETPYIDKTLNTMKEAHQKRIPIVLDCNIRQQSLGNLKIKENYMQQVFGYLDMLKITDAEAKAIASNGSIDGRIEDITLNENEVGDMASEIKKKYGIETVAITLGNRGSFISSGDGELRVRAVEPENFINSLGAGDGFDVGWCTKYLKGLSTKDAAFFASLLGSFATEEVSGYPQNLTKKKIENGILKNSESYNVDGNLLLEKLGMHNILKN